MPDTVPPTACFSSRDKTMAQRWARWQPGPPRLPGEDAAGKAFSLDSLDPGDKPFSAGNKAEDKAAVEALAIELDALQNLFYADRRHKLLVVLQGTDTSGKDGTIRGVFGRMSALGVHAVGWKAPTETELAHDYLWRIHQQVPQAGDITVFNRSHYEDVLVPVVNGWITPAQHQQRLAHINDFERMLSETGTIVLKFLLGATHTPWAPWTIVPANSKTHRNLMIATVLRQVLQNLNLRYPTGDAALEHFTVK